MKSSGTSPSINNNSTKRFAQGCKIRHSQTPVKRHDNFDFNKRLKECG